MESCSGGPHVGGFTDPPETVRRIRRLERRRIPAAISCTGLAYAFYDAAFFPAPGAELARCRLGEVTMVVRVGVVLYWFLTGGAIFWVIVGIMEMSWRGLPLAKWEWFRMLVPAIVAWCVGMVCRYFLRNEGFLWTKQDDL